MVGNALDEVDERGQAVVGDTLLILLNSHHDEVPFALPKTGEKTTWLRVFDTTQGHAEEKRFNGGTKYPLRGRSLAVFALNGPRREHQHAARRQHAGDEPRCRQQTSHELCRDYARLNRPPAKEEHKGNCPSGHGKPERRLFDQRRSRSHHRRGGLDTRN